MNDGVKILLERMQTHPQEFYGHYNRWTEVIDKFEKFFNTSERALINGALTNIRREEFTQIVMQEILREPTPVEIDPNTYTFNTVGRDPWSAPALISNQHATTSAKLALEIQKEQLEQIKQIMKDELQQATKKRSR
jgi:hypothetical protein